MDIAELKRLRDLHERTVRAQTIAALAVVVAVFSLAAAIFALSRTTSPANEVEERTASREAIYDGKLDELRRRIEQLESDTDSIREKLNAVEDRFHL